MDFTHCIKTFPYKAKETGNLAVLCCGTEVVRALFSVLQYIRKS